MRIYLPKKKGEFWEVGVGDWQSTQDSFEFAHEQVLGEGWWPAILESWSLQLRNDTKMAPQFKVFFFIVTSLVYG